MYFVRTSQLSLNHFLFEFDPTVDFIWGLFWDDLKANKKQKLYIY